jgi:hypothetical protein
MANKRMLSMSIIDTDFFLDMPLSTQCLYFHLNMRADDDGFLGGHKRIMRIIRASDDDMTVLKDKRFVIDFEDGVIVIKHWRIHNTLRKDRYNTTTYVEHAEQIKIKDNGVYTLEGEGTPLAQKRLPAGCLSIDKNRLDKNSIYEHFDLFWKAYPKKKDKKRSQETFERLSKKGILPEIEDMIKAVNQMTEYHKGKDSMQFIKNPATWLNAGSWEDEYEVKQDSLPKYEKIRTGGKCNDCSRYIYEVTDICPNCDSTNVRPMY